MADTIEWSRLRRTPVRVGDRQQVGRLVDATVVLSGGSPALHQLVIGGPRRPQYLVPASEVVSWDPKGFLLAGNTNGLKEYRIDGRAGGGEIMLADEELLLDRDIMDSQVVDLSRRRLARVSDVLIAGADRALTVTAVDLGMGALLRRIGLVRVGGRMEPKLVPWADLHLASGRAHSVQLATDADGLQRLDPLAVAELVARLPTAPAVDLLLKVGPSRSARALDVSHDVHRRRLVRAMPAGEANRVAQESSGELARVLEAIRTDHKHKQRRFRRTSGWRLYRPAQARR